MGFFDVVKAVTSAVVPGAAPLIAVGDAMAKNPEAVKTLTKATQDSAREYNPALRLAEAGSKYVQQNPDIVKKAALAGVEGLVPGLGLIHYAVDHPQVARAAAEAAVPGLAVARIAAENPEATRNVLQMGAEAAIPGLAVARIASEHPEAVKAGARAAAEAAIPGLGALRVASEHPDMVRTATKYGTMAALSIAVPGLAALGWAHAHPDEAKRAVHRAIDIGTWTSPLFFPGRLAAKLLG